MCSLKNFHRISTYFFNYRLSSLFLIFPNSKSHPLFALSCSIPLSLFPRQPSSVPVSPFAVFQPICVDQNTEAASEKRASDLPLPSFFALFLSLHLARLSAQFPRFVCGFSHSRPILPFSLPLLRAFPRLSAKLSCHSIWYLSSSASFLISYCPIKV